MSYLIKYALMFSVFFVSFTAFGYNYYELLSVSQDSSQDAIKAAYRKKTLEFHPDRNLNNPEKEEVMKEIVAAYETLSDPQKRRQYDLSLQEDTKAFVVVVESTVETKRSRGQSTNGKTLYDVKDLQDLERRAYGGSASLQNYLGEVFYYGVLNGKPIVPDYRRALYWFEKAAQQRHYESQFYAGDIILLGRGGVRSDFKRANRYFVQSRGGGHSMATFRLSQMWEGKHEIMPHYYEMVGGSDRLTRLHNRIFGDHTVYEHLITSRQHAYKIVQELERHLNSEQSKIFLNVWTFITLGEIYEWGKGYIEQDKGKAYEYYKRATEFFKLRQYSEVISADNSIFAVERVAEMLRIGSGVPKDSQAAYQEYLKAAEFGSPFSMMKVAEMLWVGEGTVKDQEAAMEWVQKAKKAGHKEANSILRQLRRITSNSILQKALRRIRPGNGSMKSTASKCYLPFQ